ncbi:hypothetical protein JOF56_001215 [Kibdelosporangium banguiense]|uniref:DUF6542 domain-containing protein n=1 Tax=Kibdelosporangium banguiense TaxID=1365924 RepID=A0ABS4T8T4_9PSEU|nr:DUF6542 domain-containing protein [Kibdelosporangium banguiense]MBP2320830.1 hypothetical protein [Kibdelosporangium banguiense]
MTATRDRDSDLDTDAAEAAWDERPVFGSRRGLPWWAAVLVALLLSVAGAVVDKGRLVDDQRLTAFGLYHALFLAGCLLAVLAVQRRNLFGPMVQPPLIFAVTFIPVQFMAREAGQSTETGGKKLIFEVALPLASSFPWMAGATAATIVIGVIRLFAQRNPERGTGSLDAEESRPPRRDKDRDRDRDDDRPRRPARDRDERPSKPARPPRDDWDRDDRDRAPERDRGRQRPPQATRREQSPPPRRPSRDDRDRDRGERSDRGERRERSDRGERGNRSEAPPRRNPPRPRDQGDRPQQGRRPRD